MTQVPTRHRATPANYAQAVRDYSRQTIETTLFPGSNYLPLANFLSRPYSSGVLTPPASRQTTRVDDAFVFATLHEFGDHDHHKVTNFTSGNDGLTKYAQYDTASECGRLLFLRGFPSPDWLNLIGSRHRVDPEFFRRHLNFIQPPDAFDLPATPLSSSNFFTLPVITIGKRQKGYTGINLSVLEDRERSADKMATYLRELSITDIAGQSIVRKFFIHDATYFTIEQDVSVYVRGQGKSWDTIIWLDSGRDLTTCQVGPWLDPPGTLRAMEMSFLPVFQHYPKMALTVPGPESLNVPGSSHHRRTTGGFHSVSAMHENYGKTLDPSIVRCDVFYALSELFRFSCSASNQAMNLIEKNIDECAVVGLSDRALSLSNLQTSKTHLDAQLQRLHFLHTFVKNRKNRNWPVASQSEHVKIADETARDLLEGYDHLVHRVTALSKRCSDSTTSLMNQSMLEESRNAISQARIVGRLTLLAFFFIPLSFTTSFFGMNVRELVGEDGPKMSVWLWFVVTAPIFLISLAVCFWGTIEPRLRRWSEYLQRNLEKSVQ